MKQTRSHAAIFQAYRDIFDLKPNDLGSTFLTRWYKRSTGPLKQLPFVYFIPIAIIAAVIAYLSFGSLVIKLTSLLQYGF